MAVDTIGSSGESCNERLYFEERDQVYELLNRLVNSRPTTPQSDLDRDFLADHATILQILDRYLEQSHLLDSHLRDMLAPLVAEIKRVMIERVQTAEALDGVAFPCQVYRNPRLHKLFQIVYQLCKVRGYKTVVKLLPHEVSDFEPTVQLLQSQDRSDYSTWEMRYVLLLWLSMLCLVPFHLTTIDSSFTSDNTTGTILLVSNIITLCKGYLCDPGATQVAAAVCLSRLLSRPDMEQQYLIQFLHWANRELIRAAEITTDMRVLQFKVTGIMRCLAHIAKNAPREQHIEASRVYFATVMKLVAQFTNNHANSNHPSSNILHRKLSVKLVQRLGMLYLSPKVRSWRYSRGLRSLEINMQLFGLITNTTGSSTRNLSCDSSHETDDEMFYVVEELEQIVEALLCGLRDKDTVVRWSAAKGVGRITGRLPYEFADDIVLSVLELFVVTEDDGAWHGASLALAELARRGVLLPQRLPDAVDCVARALQYDVRRGAYSIGAHVRDAACYACWSFARAYEPSLLTPWLTQVLAPAMLVNCVFDRELNCRRAASAAFQENVGRQGRLNFPNGIDLLTKADYFSVVNIRHAYLDVSVFIATYPEYRYALLKHLLDMKIVHWDVQIRTLAAAAMGKIGVLDPSHATRQLFPQLLAYALSSDAEVIVRHGALLSIAELLTNLAQVPVYFDGELQKKVKMLPIEIDKRRLFRGRGGDMIRCALCNVIEVTATSRMNLGFAHIKKYLAILEECFVNPNESVRDAAIAAFGAFTAQYCRKVFQKDISVHVKYMQEIIPRYINCGIMILLKENSRHDRVPNPNVTARRGFLQAVGIATKELIQPCIVKVLDAVIQSTLVQEQQSETEDPGSRVAAVQALVNLCSRPPAELDICGMEGIVVQTLVQCIQRDYRLDERGDVGSWVRKEAMKGLEKLMLGESSDAQDQHGLFIGASVLTDYGVGIIVDKLSARKLKSGERSESNPVCYVKFEKPVLGYYYFSPNGVGLIHARKLIVNTSRPQRSVEKSFLDFDARMKFAIGHTNSDLGLATPFVRRLSPDLVGSVVGALAKQLAEKLDSIRNTAGKVLFRLLHSTNPRVDGIPNRLQLEEIFPSRLVINWSRPHDTFPLVVKMMEIPDFMEEIAAGLVISVGGLTESVVKASKESLFNWMRTHLRAQKIGLLERFGLFLVTLLSRHHLNDRVAIPLMKTLALLLESNLFRFLFPKRLLCTSSEISCSDFGERLYAVLRHGVQRCSSIPKLSAAISVLIGLLPSDPKTETKTLRALVLFLGHKFPKIRTLTAEKLYTRLLLHDEVIDTNKCDSVVQVLSDTAWDASISQVRSARDKLLQVLGMDIPPKKTPLPLETQAIQGAQNYQELIKETGY
ncbi:uncharacterized protein CCR75_006565 [Bremia lactucae]|uniref:Tubulin-specific chaperone D n=1 Tax=Bremia lactucae TaxID=4779 RepID=A0A976FJ66_BRELC|nr:hypothetical protein CCR75_006565 [Bremia lactucae]